MSSQPCHCPHTHSPVREAALLLCVAVVVALLLLFCGVALLGVHVCGDEVGVVVSLWRGGVGVGNWLPVWSWQWVSTYIGGQS